MRIDGQIGFEDVDEDYKNFVDKFKPKKTTDDCYTPPGVYAAVLSWTEREYGVDPEKVLRPFYPGGDYLREEYPPGYVVVDNPPFSILSEIVTKYMAAGVPFLLFAPHLTCFNICAGRTDVTRLICNSTITYENGAQVNTDFVTNLDRRFAVRTVPELRKAVNTADAENKATKSLPRYEYPPEIITAARIGNLSRYGLSFDVKPSGLQFIKHLDAQRPEGKSVFGGGYLISKAKAAELTAAEARAEEIKRTEVQRVDPSHVWELSARERLAVDELGKKENE